MMAGPCHQRIVDVEPVIAVLAVDYSSDLFGTPPVGLTVGDKDARLRKRRIGSVDSRKEVVESRKRIALSENGLEEPSPGDGARQPIIPIRQVGDVPASQIGPSW